MTNAPVTMLDRLMVALRELVRAEDPGRTYRAIYEYSVHACDGHTVEATPLDPAVAPPLPAGVPYRPSLGGAFSVPTQGTTCYVFFANGDSTKPRLLGYDETLPTSSTVDATVDILIGGAAAQPLSLASLVASELGSIAVSIGQIAVLLNAPGPVVGAPGAVTPYVPSSTATTKAKGV